jgi:hypothetical protein
MDAGSTNFLEQTYTIWDRSFGDPRRPESEAKFDGKLEGYHVFPFSIPFPKNVNLATFEAVHADGQPVESQTQLFPQGAGLGGRITAFPPESPLQKSSLDLGANAIEEAPSRSGISPFYVNSSPIPEKVPLSARPEPGLGQESLIGTPFFLGPSSFRAGSPPSFERDSQPGPSTISPYTVCQQNAHTPTARKERKGSRWSFPRSTPASIPHVQNKRRDRKASRTVPAEPAFGSQLHIFSPLGGRASVRDPVLGNPVPACKMDITAVLPQSFLERDVGANTKYELTLYISHGGFFSSDK